MRAQRASGTRPAGLSGWAWWRRTPGREMRAGDAGRDQAERLLALAGFADRRLDDEETARIAASLLHDPDAAADVAAARALGEALPPADERMIARAAALVDRAGEYGQVILFPLPQPAPVRGWRGATAWSSLAAAIALASWLGFDLGSGTSLLRPHNDPVVEDAAASGSLEPPLVRDFNEGWQT